MTLSILIPTYNYNARALVHALLQVIERESIDAEIIIGDDASSCKTAWMDEVTAWNRVQVVHYAENAGRAAHRNRMAEAAEGKWLLFIDCDASVEKDFSLKSYFEKTSEANVICGGLRHPDINPTPEATLRYKYERAADRHRTATERNKNPYANFTPFNLFILRDVFLSIRFNEDCKEYGYEDALLGVELKQQHIPVLHIDNPLVHTGLESNEIYLKKTETALRTLKSLHGKMHGYSLLENTANKLQRWHLAGIYRYVFKVSSNCMRRNLLGQRPNLTIFSLYKLGYFLNLSPQS